MTKELVKIPLRNGFSLVVDVYGAEPDCCNDEISVSVVDANGSYMQDIVCVRESYKKNDIVEVLVYGDTYDEDYTDKFDIEVYKGD